MSTPPTAVALNGCWCSAVKVPGCSLCDAAGGALVFEGERFRVIRADEAGFPAFYRLVWRDHRAELSDLSRDERVHCMEAVVLVEQVLRQQLQPAKINLAALGNMVPHLHWHIIARFDWDSHFPAPVWGVACREPAETRLDAIRQKMGAVDAQIARALAALSAPAVVL